MTGLMDMIEQVLPEELILHGALRVELKNPADLTGYPDVAVTGMEASCEAVAGYLR